jgi:homoaconitase/3-isopropylmalate dehydratase large subunit
MLCLLAMNDDKVPAGKYAVSTSNNFEGHKGLVQER